jgi:hypothetical protein
VGEVLSVSLYLRTSGTVTLSTPPLRPCSHRWTARSRSRFGLSVSPVLRYGYVARFADRFKVDMMRHSRRLRRMRRLLTDGQFERAVMESLEV